MPYRVVHQFGYEQFIPINPISPMEGTARARDVNSYTVKHEKMEAEWFEYSPSKLNCCVRDTGPGKVADGYEQWYYERTHIRINSKENLGLSPVDKPPTAPAVNELARLAHPY